jgi:hypothetical protein
VLRKLAAFFFAIYIINREIVSLCITSVHLKREVGSLAAIKTITCLIAGKGCFFILSTA